MASSTLTSKGQMTVPKEIRDRFKLKSGDRIDFVVDEERIVMVPARLHIGDLVGILPPPKRPVSLAKMEKAIRRRALERAK